MDKAPKNLAYLMMKASRFKSLMCAAIDAKNQAEVEAKLSNGLVKGHAYTISSTARVSTLTCNHTFVVVLVGRCISLV